MKKRKTKECMRGSRKFCQSGSNLDNVFFSFSSFLVGGGWVGEDPKITQSAIWRTDGGPALNAGLVAL